MSQMPLPQPGMMPPQAQLPPAIGSLQQSMPGSDVPSCPCCGQPMPMPFNGPGSPNMPSPAQGAAEGGGGQAEALMALLGAGGGMSR